MLNDHVLWYVVVGLLTASMGLLAPLLKRPWISAPQLHMLAGLGIGPLGLGLISLNWVRDAGLLEVLSELAVIVSLYAAGMKMRLPIRDRRWITPAVLASLTMIATVALVAGAGYAMLGLPLPAALLLAAVLAPTDPVLADEVQVEHPCDDDRLRRALTGEAGFNDGTAFPFVLLAVGLIGRLIDQDLHPLGEGLWRWLLVDCVWKIAGGLAFGTLAGRAFGWLILYCRKRLEPGAGAEELLTLGLIGLTYGLALLIDTYAFLAVFAGAVALRGLEIQEPHAAECDPAEAVLDDCGTEPGPPADGASNGNAGCEAVLSETEESDDAPAAWELAQEQTRVADALERMVQLFLAVVIGLLLSPARVGNVRAWLFAAVVLFVARPLALYATTWFCDLTGPQRRLTAWFGIRGIGTIYYLSHAFGLGVGEAMPEFSAGLADCAILTIAASVLLHGFTVTPLMNRYAERYADPPTAPADRPSGGKV
ncbi:cation:proton antiporter [Alienimonas sp. DA493]|uniref:cation:proton antiporter domain-containing protein n=1 Tax=Alienimonas sp. DA493 TaxID=3373605 RepID=UPI003754E517